MENKTIRQTGNVEKQAVRMIPLSSWRKVLISQRLREGVFLKEARHIHHCAECDCIMICSYKYCGSFQMSCPECSSKKRSSQGGY